MTKPSPSILPLKLNDICYSAGNRRLIKNITCQFEAGHRYCIIGPNGAGKTLLLRLCHGLLKPESGSVTWQGALGKLATSQHQSMVFQSPVMLRRSAWDNIDYALSVHGITKSQRKIRIEEVLARTGLDHIAKRSARLLSLGQQQRLAIARAWALNPQVLFMDEPTASLDPPAAHSIEELIHEIAASGVSIIMTTHDLGQAKRIAQEIIFMFRGRIKEQAPSDIFFNNPQNDLAQAFLNGQLLWWKRRPDGDDVQIPDNPN